MGDCIGQRGKHIPKERVFDYVAGFERFEPTATARDYQKRTTQWLQAKTFDTFGPFGSPIVTLDELADPITLELSTRLNGQVMQDSNTSDFIFDIPTVISYVSQFLTLDPGDVIATGTPSGVGDARTPPVDSAPRRPHRGRDRWRGDAGKSGRGACGGG